MKNLKTILVAIAAFIGIAVFSKLGSELGETLFTEDKKVIDLDKPWFRNSLYGLSFETPEELKKREIDTPPGYEEQVKSFNLYDLEFDDLYIMFYHIDSEYDNYDLKGGLKSSLQNSINKIDGSNLELNYTEFDNSIDDLMASGTFKRNDVNMFVKGYIYWNGEGKILSLATFLVDNPKNRDIMDKIFSSRRVNF